MRPKTRPNKSVPKQDDDLQTPSSQTRKNQKQNTDQLMQIEDSNDEWKIEFNIPSQVKNNGKSPMEVKRELKIKLRRIPKNDEVEYSVLNTTGNAAQLEESKPSGRRKSKRLLNKPNMSYYDGEEDEKKINHKKTVATPDARKRKLYPKDITEEFESNESEEVDENNMDNANIYSPPKRNKVNDSMQTPSKRNLRTPLKTTVFKTPSGKSSCLTPSIKNLNLNTPTSHRKTELTPGNKSCKRSLSKDLGNSVEANSYSSKLKKAQISYNDFEDIDSQSESGDDGDEDFKPDEDEESSEDYESDISEDDDDDSGYNGKNQGVKTSRYKCLKTPKKSVKVSVETPTKQLSRLSLKSLTPSVHRRTVNVSKPSTPLQEARQKLHVSILPKSLPCREEQFNDIYTFLSARLSDLSGGCIYISGTPGTGKTATVNEVIRILRKNNSEFDEFQFVDINGMKLSEPRQAYVQIWKQLTGETKTWEEAHKLLHERFTKPKAKKSMTLLLVDELDLLCTKRQDVVYNLLDWPSKQNAKLVVVTIANTMDLPERLLMGKVTSRLGLTRLTFPPYTYKQLEEIVVSRLKGQNAFSNDTIELVSRKVAAVSGDARRALDICRRSAEVAEMNGREIVTMKDVKQALDEMIASPKIQAIKHCSLLEQLFLQAVSNEVTRTGFDEVVFQNVYNQLRDVCRLHCRSPGEQPPNVTQVLGICARLGCYRLLICEHSRADIHQRIMLNVSVDDVYFATKDIKF